tara:strand:- start:76 stop:192 length:117 start_codon:yes stop_codon:yes gene_type:complete
MERLNRARSISLSPKVLAGKVSGGGVGEIGRHVVLVKG